MKIKTNLVADTFDILYDSLVGILKEGTIDQCPSCNTRTEIHPNPYYYHECEHCGWTGSYNQCKQISPKIRIKKLLEDYYL